MFSVKCNFILFSVSLLFYFIVFTYNIPGIHFAAMADSPPPPPPFSHGILRSDKSAWGANMPNAGQGRAGQGRAGQGRAG